MLYQVEFGERKNLKEQKYSTNAPSTTAFVYGKKNFFYYLKTGVQQQVLLANKGNKSGVNISANFGGGVSFGLLRPYLIQVIDQTELTSYESWQTWEKDSTIVIGGPSIAEGWSGLKLIPGLYAKGGIRFDFAHSGAVLTALEIGVSAELYTKNIEQILRATQKQGFTSIYLTILFGGRSRY
ncbi:MAG: hypothetical protein HY305_05590 [Sphingobacteriales bacterium]|nr:hypothetical protein [Sphingobacteriales bacterium]